MELEGWQGVYKATKVPKSCPQITKTYSDLEIGCVGETDENCLFLNVFLPGKLEEGGGLAVMVWVHGGGYFQGSSTMDLYDGRFLAATTNTIVVSFNYRLGAFGFFSVRGESTEENVGLLDQVVAIM